LELPVKAIVRGYSWTVIPVCWRNRRDGVSKPKIKEMGSRYFVIIAYVWLENYFSRGDYVRKEAGDALKSVEHGACQSSQSPTGALPKEL